MRYLHSDIDTLERVEIIRDLRLGTFDVLIGVNLLREGLDIPECAFMAILDADKEGFLRSATSLVQTIGRAARNAESKVVLYADKMTDSMRKALEETDRRRAKQVAYNEKHNITPVTVLKKVGDMIKRDEEDAHSGSAKAKAKHAKSLPKGNPEQALASLRTRMLEAAANLEFETAARLRDDMLVLEKHIAKQSA